jgi:hypothetical protein
MYINNSAVQKTTIIIYILLSVAYVVWRICFTLNSDQIVASVIFLFVDIVSCFSAILFVVSIWRKPTHITHFPSTKQFSIDVFVLTCNEDCEMLKSTLQH